jgi:hypothetical protein
MRVYVNSVGLDVPDGATALDAVRAWNATAADSRGLATSPETRVHGGAIFRVLPVRRRADGDEPND